MMPSLGSLTSTSPHPRGIRPWHVDSETKQPGWQDCGGGRWYVKVPLPELCAVQVAQMKAVGHK